MIRYENAVKRGCDIINRHERDLWQLGKIVAEVEPKYGEQTLSKLAEAWGKSVRIVWQYCQVHLAYEQNRDRSRYSFSTALILVNEPDREQLLRRPRMTQRRAGELVQERRQSAPSRSPVHTMATLAERLAKQLDEIFERDSELEQQLNYLINNDAELETTDRRRVDTALKKLIQRLNQSLERFRGSELSGDNVVTLTPQRRLT